MVIGAQALDLTLDEAANLEEGLSALLDATPARARRRDDLPPNAGAAWDEEQDTQLAQRWYAGDTIGEIARDFGRTDGSISSRLVRIGLVENREEARSRRKTEREGSADA
ncbi:hypothetical protein [Caenispirillum bisanense]|uniref:hypothetical protein n=1 Tax=Caenispirillum bisanense TaxID=414052 RepID=UPI0031D48B9F